MRTIKKITLIITIVSFATFNSLTFLPIENSCNIALSKQLAKAIVADDAADCTRTVFDDNCKAVWEPTSCKVKVGTTNCSFSNK